EDLCVLVLGGRPTREKLESFFPEGVPKNLTFPGQKDDVRPFLWAADIGFVLSTDVETISFACREMMACGLPMLVSDVGCLAENVDESCGWIVEPANSNVIANLIPAILKADLQQMSQAARLKAERSFDVENFTSRTYQVYREVSEATNGL
ncbi:MAG: glycosyltransferase family 4 protein, partial [Litorivicinaceae bacterium]